MDLFKLLGTIAVDNKEAVNALDETSKSGEKAESKLGKAFKAVGNGALAVGKAVGTGMLVAGTAVAGLVTKSIQAYADYEQLVGGVETLFGAGGQSLEEYAKSVGKTVEQAKVEYDKLMQAQSAVLDHANEAYKTAGLSANEYMETVTSFSASLLQSLGGDTVKAAEVADRAIIDMSDNANKMGTSMEMIQNAYNGFAKQNYTMLDNLKLGYGGTKEEMERLIQDAAKMKDVQKELGITVDANSMSFGNIVNAISVMQEKMGIAGTTAKEASSTISGSLNMMKASWTNLLTGISDDNANFDNLINNFVDSVSAVAGNLMPRIQIALGGVVKLIDKLVPVILEKIPGLVSELLPSIVNAATSLVQSLVGILPNLISAITDILPAVISGFESIFNGLVNALPSVIQALLDALPTLIRFISNALDNIFVTICKILPDVIQPILEAIPGLVELLVGCLLESIPVILESVMTLFTSLINMLPVVIPQLLQAVVSIIEMIYTQLPVILPQLLNGLMTLITLIIGQIPVLIPMIVQACLQIINLLSEQLPILIPMLIEAVISIVYLLIEQIPIIIPMLIEAVITIVMAIVQALPGILKALTDALPVILKAVWDAIVMIFMNLPQWFGQIFSGAVEIIKAVWDVVAGFFAGIWDAICQVFAPVGEWFKNIFTSAWDGIKNIWSGVKNFFSNIWSGIKNAFSAVGTFFKNAFQGAWNAVKNVFSGVKNFFTGIWDTIKNAFSAIGTKIGDAISGAVKKGINGLLGSAENIINGFLKMINGAIGLINKIPGVNISKVKMVSFTKLAEGGVVDKPTPALFGEDGAEAVVPLEKNTGWLNKVAKQLHEFSVESRNDYADILSRRAVDLQQQQVSEMQTLNEKTDKIINLLIQFFPELLNALDFNMYLDSNLLVAGIAPQMDAELGRIAIKKGRGR